jgi:hypothetical protein
MVILGRRGAGGMSRPVGRRKTVYVGRAIVLEMGAAQQNRKL